MTNPLPPKNCQKCSRLVAYRQANRAAHADWFNAPVPCFGDPQAALLIVGLAPGRKGANRTGRPFTGDMSGKLLYSALRSSGFAEGTYYESGKDDIKLKGCMISNAVRCVPPENKPTPAEIDNCRPYLQARLASLPRLKAVLVLGKIAHDSVLSAQNMPPSKKSMADLSGNSENINGLPLYTFYHPSPLNRNRMNEAGLTSFLTKIKKELELA